MTKEVNILVTGDLHFGKPSIDHTNMYSSLTELFTSKIQDAHMVVIAGDYFDTLLDFNSNYATYAVLFIRDVLRECSIHNVKLRVIRGTYLHDRDQCKLFESLISKKLPVDYKYITTIDIEEVILNDRKMYFGYLPDSLPYKEGNKVVDVLSSTMNDLGIEKLNTIFGHGTFDHTLPFGISLPPCTYTTDMFRELTDIVVMNHIHISSKKEYVYYAGSFDRMSHNEEGAKGYLSITYSDEIQVTFRKNPRATLFKTIDLAGMSAEEATDKLTAWLDKHIPDHRSYVRIIHQDVEIRNALQKITTDIKPNTICTVIAPRSDKVQEVSSLEEYHQEVAELVVPTVDNLPGLVHDFILTNVDLPSKEKLSEEEVVKYLEVL